MGRQSEFQRKLKEPGLQFLDGAKIVRLCRASHCPFLTTYVRPLMLAARHESGIQALLNGAIAFDKLGTARADWASLISTGDSKKFLMGLWGVGLSGEKKTGLSLWELAKPSIAKRDGEYVAARFPASLTPKSFFGDHVRIEYASHALPALFKCIGYEGRDAGSRR